MFQDFEEHFDPQAGAPRIDALREQFDALGIDGFLVPREDEFMGEYVPACHERVKWLTGFGGSAGIAAIMRDKAALLVDGRYTLQAAAQVDTDCLEIVPIVKIRLENWLLNTMSEGQTLGYDPRLHSIRQIEKLTKAMAKNGVTLTPLEVNPIDAAWHDRPPLPTGPVVAHGLEYAGMDSTEKRAKISAQLVNNKVTSVLLTQPESLAWLLNIRGYDVPHTPFALSFALLQDDGAVNWYIDPDRVSDAVMRQIGAQVVCYDPTLIAAHLHALTGSVQLDPETTPQWFLQQIKADIVRAADPCSLPKACKTEAEINGARAAHMRDGIALCTFLCWLEENAAGGGVSEIDAVRYLEQCRSDTGALKDLSFDTISGSGPNGAIVHYRVTEATNRKLQPGELFLVDSGGQYLDGTTDVTRTVLVHGAPPPDKAVMAFTRVLKGHIALAAARFPDGTDGIALDALARAPLWAVGLDFDHGTGHGVGSYLSVHEGPQRISKGGTQALKPGMIVSNEPGYYEAGAFGIRIENLQTVIEPELPMPTDRQIYGFEVLTLAPIDHALIDIALLTHDEIDWLNAYHARVAETLSPHMDEKTRDWLQNACCPVT